VLLLLLQAKTNATSREASGAALYARHRPNVFMEIPQPVPDEPSSVSPTEQGPPSKLTCMVAALVIALEVLDAIK
jgi:hypothetical protein